MFINAGRDREQNTHGTAADGIRLAVEYMNARTVFHNHDFMKIMMMFRESGLRQTGFQSPRALYLMEKSHAYAVRSWLLLLNSTCPNSN